MYTQGGFEKPVNVDDVIQVTIESTGAKGDGIAKVDGFVIVVPGGKEGETVKVKITRVLRKMAFAELATEGAESEETATEEVHEEAATEEVEQEEELPPQDGSSDEE
jgi:predicted RNA-binding protein with TRAM domain